MTKDLMRQLFNTARNADSLQSFERVATEILSASIADTAGAKPEPLVTLSGAQLLEAFNYVAPDHPNDPDQLECDVTIAYGEGHSGKGHYCWITDYPDEGAILLDGKQAEGIAAPPAPSSDTAGAIYQVDNGEGGWIDVGPQTYKSAAGDVRRVVYAAPPAPSVADAKPCTCHPDDNPPAPCAKQYALNECRSVADAAGASEALPENIDWTRVMALAEKHGDGWSEAKGWSFHCDDDLFNFAGELAKESGND